MILFTRLFIVCFVVFLSANTFAQSTEKQNRYFTEAGITLSHFQQQVKSEIGAERGERLTNEFQIGFYGGAAYKFNEYFGAGIFLRYDRGQRQLANFGGFDQEGKTVVEDKIGGTYTEFWMGPVVHFFYKQVRASFGYGLFGTRDDNARKDIPSKTGDTDSAFSLDPSFAWLFSVTGMFTIIDNLNLAITLEYRARYYNTRGGNKLQNNINHGTQSITPLFGITYGF